MVLTEQGRGFARLLEEVDDVNSLEPLEIIILELYKRGGVSSARSPVLTSVFREYNIGTFEAMELMDNLVTNGFAVYGQ